MRMITLISLLEPCFVFYNKNYCEKDMYNRHTDERTAYVVNPMSMWGNIFLAPLIYNLDYGICISYMYYKFRIIHHKNAAYKNQ